MYNLMSTPWTERDAAPGFGYTGGFQDILTAYNGLNHRGANVRYHDNQNLLEEQIIHLTKLKQELETDEDKFFEMFGIKGKDKKESFRLLKNKVAAWNKTKANVLLNDRTSAEFWDTLSILQKRAAYAETSEAEWTALLDATFDTANKEDIKQMLDANPDLNIGHILNKILEKDKSKFSTSKKSSLVANITVSLDENGDIKIKTNRGNISTDMQLKLIRELKKYLQANEKKVRPNYDFKGMFEEIFTKVGITPTGQKYIKMALGDSREVLDKYAFSSNKSQIKGFMGEIYNNAFLFYMADGSKAQKDAIDRITPTGTMLNTEGKEIVIDTWLKGFGIQVKNYEHNKVIREGYETHKSYDAGYFIREVLQLSSVGTSSTASVGDILLNFFTAYDYNQDYGKVDNSVTTTDGYKFWKQARERMDSKFKDMDALHNILLPYIDKILGIDKTFETKDGSFVLSENTPYFRNTFFNISGDYIPSSYLIQAIIDALEKKKKDSLAGLVQARFHVSHSPSGKDMWHPGIDNSIVAQVFNQREDYADATRIGYSITLDINEIVNNLLK